MADRYSYVFAAGLIRRIFAKTRLYCASARSRASPGMIAISDHTRITVTLRYLIGAEMTARSFVTGT
jgi:hypothetical protein